MDFWGKECFRKIEEPGQKALRTQASQECVRNSMETSVAGVE